MRLSWVISPFGAGKLMPSGNLGLAFQRNFAGLGGDVSAADKPHALNLVV